MTEVPVSSVPRRNRVTPWSELVAVPDRGTFIGNRGVLHDENGTIVRNFTTRSWIVCRLEFRGRWRPVFEPNRWTGLFFLDEPTALAAGHRPCGECRNADYRMFRAAFERAHPCDAVGVAAIDARLHADRLTGRAKRTYQAALDSLPDGAIIDLDSTARLVLGSQLLAWAPGGYTDARSREGIGDVTVLTPRSTVATLAAGYPVRVHESATA